ncbi:MAG: NAD(P)-dependent oxidoreductase, partial [Limnohabitans sp.]
MVSLIKRVVRSDLWVDGVFEERLSREPDIEVVKFSIRGAAQVARDALSAAHVYHISAAKDELPREWFASAELLSMCPNLLCVSAGGAGYDTVDVAACTAAGVAVVNQSGGNAVSVAEHTLGLMLGVSRRMLEGDRRMRREVGYAREDVMGHELAGKTVGLVGIGNIGSRVAALARAFGMQVVA